MRAPVWRSSGTPACPACGGETRPWGSAPASELGVGEVALARCGDCGTAVTVDPAPVDVDLHERGDYAAPAPRGVRLAGPMLRGFDAQRLGLLERGLAGRGGPAGRDAFPGGTGGPVLVDAGAGRGRFVAHARAAGYVDATGVEPTVRGVDGARARHGLALTHTSIGDARIADGSVDAVTLWHVLEHVGDPGATLDVLRGWLRPGGVLLVGVPNLDAWQARVGGRRWYHLDLPRHRTHFTARGLERLLADRGFEVVHTTHLLAEHNPFGMWQSAVSRGTSRPSYLFHLLKRNAPLDGRDLAVTVAGLALLPLAVAVEVVAGLCRRGGTVAVLARRSS